MQTIPFVFATCLACGAAHWSVIRRSPQHRLPQGFTLFVVMSDRVADMDSGLAAAVVDSLATELAARGFQVEVHVARPGDESPEPRVELRVTDSDSGSDALRGAGQHLVPGAGLAGSAKVTVECYVVQANGIRTFAGRISASTISNTTGYDSVEAGMRVGSAIAEEIAE